jgi:hypothetical protein
MKRLLIMAFAVTLFDCSNSEKPVLSIKELAFKKFVSRQNIVDLPLHFDLDGISDSQTQPMIVDDLDSLFIPTDYAAGRIWGIYKDTSQYFTFITLGAASVYIPQIKIFDKQGNKIQETELLVDGCGADCGYFCSAIAKVYKDDPTSDIKFYARDSVLFYTCDSVGKETPGTKKHYIKYKSGFVDKSGHITVTTGSVNFLR